MRLTVEQTRPTQPPPKRIILELTTEEATELATIFHYQVSGHWILRDNMPGSVALLSQLEREGIHPNRTWGVTRLLGQDIDGNHRYAP